MGASHLERVYLTHSLTTIGESAFAGCSNLSSIVIPDSVEYMDGYVFSSCHIVVYIEFEYRPKTWSSNWDNNGNAGGFIHQYWYRAERPTGTGQYWYYDGNTIKQWE